MHDFRNMLVEKALKHRNYIEARDLCIKGIEIAERKSHRGIVTQYKHKLLEIAEKQKDIREIRALSEKLFFDNQYNLEYYRKLKSTWEKDKWSEKCEEIINKIKKPLAKGSYYDANALANVFIEEGYTDRLLLLLQINNIHLRFIDSYSAYLVEKYPAEIVELYEKSIFDYAEYTGRSVYNDVVRYLKKMAKIPGGELVAHKMVSQFKEKYRNRRAMLEVLNKHFK